MCRLFDDIPSDIKISRQRCSTVRFLRLAEACDDARPSSYCIDSAFHKEGSKISPNQQGESNNSIADLQLLKHRNLSRIEGFHRSSLQNRPDFDEKQCTHCSLKESKRTIVADFFWEHVQIPATTIPSCRLHHFRHCSNTIRTSCCCLAASRRVTVRRELKLGDRHGDSRPRPPPAGRHCPSQSP